MLIDCDRPSRQFHPAEELDNRLVSVINCLFLRAHSCLKPFPNVGRIIRCMVKRSRGRKSFWKDKPWKSAKYCFQALRPMGQSSLAQDFDEECLYHSYFSSVRWTFSSEKFRSIGKLLDDGSCLKLKVLVQGTRRNSNLFKKFSF